MKLALILFYGVAAMSFDPKTYKKPSPDELKKQLSPQQYACSQGNDTEAPFRNEFWNKKDDGIYVDVVSGEPLFSSLDKFDSGSGWPSFTKPLETGNVENKEDKSHGATRTEVRSKHGEGHLGHVFDDGPKDKGGLRYCINSASIKFIPLAEMKSKGYGQYVNRFSPEARKKANIKD